MNVLAKSITSALLVGIAVTASAQPTGNQRGPMPFSDFDADGSGFISEQEFYAARGERMAARAKEGGQMRNVGNSPSYASFDLNGDGQLSPEEFAGGHKMQGRNDRGPGMRQGGGRGAGRGAGMGRNMPGFAEFDLNGDGAIVKDEFIDARNNRISERAGQGYPMRGLSNAQPFSEIDTDGDGKVTAEEFSAAQAMHGQPRSAAY